MNLSQSLPNDSGTMQKSYLLGKCTHRSAASSVLPYMGKWPEIHGSVFIADGARIIGDVDMGENCSVWFNAVVRGDVHIIRIGSRTNIQDSAVVHCTYKKFSTIIGDDVSIAHLAMIHGCTIQDRCLIGMQSIVMDGAVIGHDSIVAAGSVVSPGTIIPPRSLVLGTPAKVIRQVRDAELEGILATTKRYIEYTLGYDFKLQGE